MTTSDERWYGTDPVTFRPLPDAATLAAENRHLKSLLAGSVSLTEHDRVVAGWRTAVVRFMAEVEPDWRELWEQELAGLCGAERGVDAVTWRWAEAYRRLAEERLVDGQPDERGDL